MSNHKEPELFDFGLNADQEERARRLHAESIIIDMMFLGPTGPSDFTDQMNARLKEDYERHCDHERTYWMAAFQAGHLAARDEFSGYRDAWDTCGVTAGSLQCGIGSFDKVLKNLGRINSQFDHFPWLIKATTAEHVRQAKESGGHAGFIHTQDTESIGQELDKLDLLYELGMRVVQLTYNSMNFVGVGCTERVDAGVSNFGVSVIERMNKLGMIIDISHCGPQTTLDACQISETPVLATHTGVKALSGQHDRCKRDEEMETIAGTGGVVGVVTAPAFLSAGPGATMEDLLDHVDYMVRLIGPEHVGIGTDWPNCAPDWLMKFVANWFEAIGFRKEHRVDVLAKLKGFEDYRNFINITRGLVSRGYTDEQIKAILGRNFLRVIEQICG